MFALNENNSFFLRCEATDLRQGFNTLSGRIRNDSNLNPANGSVYVFVNKSRNTLKLLHWERGGFVIYHKRLESGRISNEIFKNEALFTPLRWDELVLLLEGIPPKTRRRKRYNL
ncbi:MAG: IS66 family insertion sequence element accessory protein TnpB [Clostridiales bacterium]|jgi:hypothetical protein|nr:IS66 family insertion sequence element accessory protein TnpB [Clostridiales bacterium]